MVQVRRAQEAAGQATNIDSDSSDDEDVVEVHPSRPAPKPIQPAGSSGSGCVASGSRRQRARCSSSPLVELSTYTTHPLARRLRLTGMKDPNVKLEPELSDSIFGVPSDLLVPSTSTKRDATRDPSPFGVPFMLVDQGRLPQAHLVEPLEEPSLPVDCSHGTLQHGVPSSLQPEAECTPDEEVSRDGEWGTGDDEVEILEENSTVEIKDESCVDIDLTLDDDNVEKDTQPVECCPICERKLKGMSTVVRSSSALRSLRMLSSGAGGSSSCR